MIPVASNVLFQDALLCLAAHKQVIGQGFKGRFIQTFLGLKFFQNGLPSMYSGSFILTEVLQSLLDDLFAKVSLAPNQCVLSLFEGNYLARTGLIAPGNAGPQNTWRNNFNIQKGIGCYAPVADLSSPTFLNQDRVNCRHLDPAIVGSLDGARCALCPSGTYRRESHRKWLRIDSAGNGYSVLDLQNTSNFAPYLAPAGRRIPILPLIIALYHDADPGLVLGTRSNVQLADFMADFNFSSAEFQAYFDDSMQHPLNMQLMLSTGWVAGSSLGVPIASAPPLASFPISQPPPKMGKILAPTIPNLTGTPVPPPAVNTGWEAEQFIAAALVSNGWIAHVVSRQQLGYDVFAQKGAKKRYVEVKSSLDQCSPSLTAREWQQANAHSRDYILAVIENFNPSSQNTVYWIRDPANTCIANSQTTVSYSIARSYWMGATIPLGRL